jgi:hypothetical protein
VTPAPPGAVATPPQRTESLARELVRAMLGVDGAPSLTVERGPHAGAKRSLAPPESTLVIGRGDGAHWIFDDPDLSKAHVEIKRSWDGVRARDLDSKNGTKLDAQPLREADLYDGALIELGQGAKCIALRYRDPAERHLGNTPAPARTPSIPIMLDRPKGSTTVFIIALAVAVLALAGIVWLAMQ